MSSEAPPRFRAGSTGGSIALTRVSSPDSGAPAVRCTARAKAWSSSVQAGMPTRRMLASTASASGRLKCRGHAAPSTRVGRTRVPVMSAAPWATESATAQSALMPA